MDWLLEAISWAFISCPFVLGFFWGGCTCCESCTIFSDDFSTDRTGTDYTTVSGTWTVGSGVMTTGSAGALIVEDTAGTTGHGRVTVTAKVDTAGATIRLVGSYVDSSNYLFVDFYINGSSSEIKLWERVAGVDTLLSAPGTFSASTNTNYTICLNWNGGVATALTTVSSVQRVARVDYSGAGNQAGLGATPNGGTVTFDNFTFVKDYVDDPTCATPACGYVETVTCGPCDVPVDFDLLATISGITGGTCGTCSSIDGSYVLSYWGSFGGVCYWGHQVPHACATSYVSIIFALADGATSYLVISGDAPGVQEWAVALDAGTLSYPQSCDTALDGLTPAYYRDARNGTVFCPPTAHSNCNTNNGCVGEPSSASATVAVIPW